MSINKGLLLLFMGLETFAFYMQWVVAAAPLSFFLGVRCCGKVDFCAGVGTNPTTLNKMATDLLHNKCSRIFKPRHVLSHRVYVELGETFPRWSWLISYEVRPSCSLLWWLITNVYKLESTRKQAEVHIHKGLEFFLSRQGLTMQHWAILCRSGWLQTHRYLPASASWALGLLVCATTPGFWLHRSRWEDPPQTWVTPSGGSSHKSDRKEGALFCLFAVSQSAASSSTLLLRHLVFGIIRAHFGG